MKVWKLNVENLILILGFHVRLSRAKLNKMVLIYYSFILLLQAIINQNVREPP